MVNRIRWISLVLAVLLIMSGCAIADLVDNAEDRVFGSIAESRSASSSSLPESAPSDSSPSEASEFESLTGSNDDYTKYNIYVDTMNIINTDFFLVLNDYRYIYGWEATLDTSAPDGMYYLEPEGWDLLELMFEYADLEPAMPMDNAAKELAPLMIDAYDLMDEMYEYYYDMIYVRGEPYDFTMGQDYHTRLIAVMEPIWEPLDEFNLLMVDMVNTNRLQTIQQMKDEGQLGRYHLLSIIQNGKDLSNYLYAQTTSDEGFPLNADPAVPADYIKTLEEHISGLNAAASNLALQQLESELLGHESFPSLLDQTVRLTTCLETMKTIQESGSYTTYNDPGSIGELDAIMDTIVDYYNYIIN